MGSLLPLSITTNCTMKSLLILATLLAVGHSEETKAAVVAPYHYGYPGYYGGVAAPFVYPNAAPVNYAPQTYAYAPQTAYPYTYAPYAQAYAPVAAPTPVVAPVVAAPAIIPPVSSQFHAGDEFGNSQYGYSNLNSAKHEIGNAFGQKSGSYQYVDPAGKLQTVTYVADELGFRVKDSRLPVAPVHNAELPVAPVHDAELPVAPVHEYTLPVAPVHEYTLPVAPVYDGVAPESVEETPEVAAARAEHLAAVAEVASREKRESDPMVSGYGYNSPWLLNKAYQRPMFNGVYAYNHMAYAGYYNPRFSYGFYY